MSQAPCEPAMSQGVSKMPGRQHPPGSPMSQVTREPTRSHRGTLSYRELVNSQKGDMEPRSQ